jgi:hypothetical protein
VFAFCVLVVWVLFFVCTSIYRVIAKLHTLAADPRNRPFIARDAGCLRNIIRTFDFPADDVVYKALETLSYLSSHSQENRQLLSQQPGLMPRLHEIGEMHPEEEVADLAKHLHQQLSSDKSVENPTTPEKALNRPALAMLASSKLDLLRTQARSATSQQEREERVCYRHVCIFGPLSMPHSAENSIASAFVCMCMLWVSSGCGCVRVRVYEQSRNEEHALKTTTHNHVQGGGADR